MADHCLGASDYALKAVIATGTAAEIERTWQIEQVPDQVRELIVSALESRLAGRSSEWRDRTTIPIDTTLWPPAQNWDR
jgi:hypothetical protein